MSWIPLWHIEISKGTDDANALDELIGPFHDTAQIAHRLRVSVDTVTALVRRNELLACPTAESMLVFPTFQVAADDTLLPGLGRIVATLARGTADSWQIALWMRTSSDQLHGRTPHEALQQGRSDAVERLAAQTATRWRSH
ncbi:hypothetical protein [Mycobacteroides abscessus]|nr:hypothetical protein [Mycobacteroides abscessus]SLJ81111.1 Uncharacterised protein [Mycobacteroides abscessus subsp. abscessus]SLJ81315.1 Uncharacterised protein [Mycobacteroides abscessus subsp. abscessus]